MAQSLWEFSFCKIRTDRYHVNLKGVLSRIFRGENIKVRAAKSASNCLITTESSMAKLCMILGLTMIEGDTSDQNHALPPCYGVPATG